MRIHRRAWYLMQEALQTQRQYLHRRHCTGAIKNLGIAHVDNNLNIRQEPSENAKLVGKLTKDAACEVLSTENGWAHIKSGKVEGYCNTEYLYTGDAAIERGKEAASMIAVVNTETLKVREEPNTDSTVITLIPQEEELEVVDVMDNGWIKFLLDDEEAYVSGDYVDVEERLEKAVLHNRASLWTGCIGCQGIIGTVCETVHWQSLRMGRYEPYKRCRLFRFYHEYL